MNRRNVYIGVGVASVAAFFIVKKLSKKRVSRKGIDFIKKEEGFRNKAYKDAKGLWTIGIGHLILPHEQYLLTATLTNKQVNDIFRKDVTRFEKRVNDTIKVPLTQNQFDALVSFAFNVGEAGFKSSSVARAVNEKANPQTISNMFMNWTSGGLLTKRRKNEANLFNLNKYV